MRLFYTLHWKGIGGEITRRVHLLLLFVLLSSLTLFAQIPAGYYDGANGKTGAELKTALYNIIKGHTDKGYDGLYTVYTTSDNLPSGKVWDMYSIKADGTASYWYSHTSGDRCGSYSGEGDCYNREHTFCDSWLGKASPQRSDAHHVVPTDGYVNNRRSSFPHGKVGSVSWTSTNGSKLGRSDASTGYTGTVFEPIDEFKGDFARIYFYMATRYENLISGWASNGSAGEILAGNSYPAYKTWFKNLMLQWHNLDPVSQKEIARNNAIYALQHNRNPFIDKPEYAEMIWGNGTVSVAFTSTPSTSIQAGASYNYNITVTGKPGATFTISAPTKPTWLTLTSTGNGTATLTGTPLEANVGNNSVLLRATDGTTTKEQSFTINVISANQPLQFTSTPITTGQVDVSYSYNITLTGNSGATFTITAPTKPSWLNLSNTGNGIATLSGTPTSGDLGSNSVVLNGSDGSSTVEQAFSININEATTGSSFVETFEKMSTGASNYASRNWIGDNNISWSATYARTDQKINNFAICLNYNTGAAPYLQSETINGGCTLIRFKHQQKFDAGSGGELSVFINNTLIGKATVTKTVAESSFSVNVSDNFVIKLVSNDAARIAIDDLEWQTASSSTNENPEIVAVTNSPLSPVTGQPITLSAEVDDVDGTVESVVLQWGTQVDNLSNSITMNESGELFTGPIPAQVNVGTIYYKIIATDNEGGTVSFIGYIVVGENQLPSITSESRNPANPTSVDNVGISATVTDPEGRLSTVQLQWGTASNALSNMLSMTNSSSTYSATIPAQTTGTIVYYKIKATDQEGNFSESTIQNYTVSPATGIGDNQQNKVTVYPNPFGEALNVNVETSGLTKVTVMDIIGKVVHTAEFSDKIYPINTSNLKAGIYIVKVINGEKTTVIRVIKR